MLCIRLISINDKKDYVVNLLGETIDGDVNFNDDGTIAVTPQKRAVIDLYGVTAKAFKTNAKFKDSFKKGDIIVAEGAEWEEVKDGIHYFHVRPGYETMKIGSEFFMKQSEKIVLTNMSKKGEFIEPTKKFDHIHVFGRPQAWKSERRENDASSKGNKEALSMKAASTFKK